MNKGKVVRLAGFVGALGLSTVLVTTAIQGTGAYFQDAAAGSISANSGQLSLGVAVPGDATYTAANDADLQLNFTDLWPGTPSKQQINYQVNAKGGTADLWLTFDPNTAAYQLFTGGSDAPLSIITDPTTGKVLNEGGMGAYGFFQVNDSTGGQRFKSGNLKFRPGLNYATGSDAVAENDCATDANGNGGSNWVATSTDEQTSSNPSGWSSSGYCGVPSAILLRSNISSGTGSVVIQFGLNGAKQTVQEQQYEALGFHLVATQNGQRPTV